MNQVGEAVLIQNTQIGTNLYHELTEIAKLPSTDFSKIQDCFNHLKANCPNRFDFDYVIGPKGSQFSKVLEIKAQHPNIFVPPIVNSIFKEKCTDGFSRIITINAPGSPQIEERLFIKQDANGQIDVIFVETDGKDFFTCLNRVSQRGGEWHWMGCYLYEEADFSHTHEKMKEMFDATYNRMLAYLDEKEFAAVYAALQAWH